MLGISPLPTIISPGDQGDQGPVGPRLLCFGASTYNATLVRYAYPYTTDLNVSTTRVELVNNIDGYLANLFFRVNSNAADSTSTITVYVNGSATSLSCTLAAGSTAVVSDTTHQVPVVAGDKIALGITRGGVGTFGVGFNRCAAWFERVAT